MVRVSQAVKVHWVYDKERAYHTACGRSPVCRLSIVNLTDWEEVPIDNRCNVCQMMKEHKK